MGRLTRTQTFLGNVHGKWDGGTKQTGVSLAHVVQQEWSNVAAVDTDYYLTSTATGAAASGTTFAATAPDYPRNITASFSSTGAETLTVVGKDGWGNSLTEVLSAAASPATGNAAFNEITSWAVSGDVGNVTIGMGTKFGLQYPLTNLVDVVNEGTNGNTLPADLIKSKVATSGSLTSGTTYAYTGFIPANSIVLGIRGRVTTAITSGGTINDWDLGIATDDVDRFADGIAKALGTTFQPGDGSPGNTGEEFPPYLAEAAETVTLTANGGGSFTAGEVFIELLYIDVSAALSGATDLYSTPGTFVVGDSSANADDRGTYTPGHAPEGARDYRVTYIAQTINSQSV